MKTPRNLSRELIEQIATRIDYSHRGGGVEIDVTPFFSTLQPSDPYEHTPLYISAYQNYLGGGLLGSVQSDSNFIPSAVSHPKEHARLMRYKEDLKKYFHALTNHYGDEWEETTYEESQRRPASAY